MIGWVKCITDDSVYLLEYKEKGNVSTSRDDINVSFILIHTDPLQWYEFHPNWLKLMAVPFLHSSILKANDSLSKADSIPWIGTKVIITYKEALLRDMWPLLKMTSVAKIH